MWGGGVWDVVVCMWSVLGLGVCGEIMLICVVVCGDVIVCVVLCLFYKQYLYSSILPILISSFIIVLTCV